MSVLRALSVVAAMAVALIASSNAASAQASFSVDDDDAGWIAGLVPGTAAIAPSAEDSRDTRIHETHERRRAFAWIVLFGGIPRSGVADDQAATSLRLRPFDLSTFSLELIERSPLRGSLPRAVLAHDSMF